MARLRAQLDLIRTYARARDGDDDPGWRSILGLAAQPQEDA